MGHFGNTNRRNNYVVGQIMGVSIFLEELPLKQYKNKTVRFGKFRCPCGKEFNAEIQKVNGRKAKCQECARKNLEVIGKNNFKHGLTAKIPLYGVWQGIKSRCYNPNNEFYYCYGGRGIIMFEGWIHDFKAFYDYVQEHLGKRPSEKHSIDRIKNSIGYFPGNLKWSSPKEQARNMTTNRLIEFDGMTKTMAEWAEIYKLHPTTLRDRIVKYGYSMEKAVSKPTRNKIRLVNEMIL